MRYQYFGKHIGIDLGKGFYRLRLIIFGRLFQVVI